MEENLLLQGQLDFSAPAVPLSYSPIALIPLSPVEEQLSFWREDPDGDRL